MITRIVQCQLKTDRLDQARQALTTEVHPKLRQQPGFVDVIESLDPQTGKFVCMTLWRTPEDVRKYDENTFPEIAQRLTPFAASDFTVDTLTVENSTIHRIAQGKAA
jgi:hypothetical protein